MVQYVQSSQVVNVNGNTFYFPNNPDGTPMQIPCDGTQIIDSYWMIPQVSGNRIIGYNFLVATNTSVKPQPDALKVLRLKLTNTAGVTEIDVAIADTDNVSTSSPVNQFAYLCDGLGGTLPVMPLVTFPYPIQQSGPASTASDGTNTFIFPFPDNPNGLLYTIQGAWANGQNLTPAFVPAGITTVAQVVTWANSNWSAYGTWSSPSTNILKLVSATGDSVYVQNAGISVKLTPKAYCIDVTSFSSPETVNGIKFGSGPTISITPFYLTDSNVDLLNGIKNYVASGTTFNTATAHKLGVSSTQATIHLYNDTTLVASATVGAC